MNNNKLSMEALNELRTLGAWKMMSEEFPWNEEQLERYKNNVDWNLVSGNENVAWSISLIERFKDRLNWKELSGNRSKHIFRPEIIRAFVDLWDWKELAGQSGWTLPLIEEFKDHLDWVELMENNHFDDDSFLNEAFLIKYYDFIPSPEYTCRISIRFHGNLWNKLCEDLYKKLSDEVSGMTKK